VPEPVAAVELTPPSRSHMPVNAGAESGFVPQASTAAREDPGTSGTRQEHDDREAHPCGGGLVGGLGLGSSWARSDVALAAGGDGDHHEVTEGGGGASEVPASVAGVRVDADIGQLESVDHEHALPLGLAAGVGVVVGGDPWPVDGLLAEPGRAGRLGTAGPTPRAPARRWARIEAVARRAEMLRAASCPSTPSSSAGRSQACWRAARRVAWASSSRWLVAGDGIEPATSTLGRWRSVFEFARER
jgi:hypothetical protein